MLVNCLLMAMVLVATPFPTPLDVQQSRKVKDANSLFDASYAPSKNLLQLLHLLGRNDNNNSIEAINIWAQSHLLRQKERWDPQTNVFESKRKYLYPLLQNLGFVDEVKPSFKEYQAIIIYGALLPRVQNRISYLIKQFKKGITFSHIYLLGSERTLQNSEKLVLGDLACSTEMEMIRILWKRMTGDIFKGIEVHYICAPQNGLKRAITDDTVNKWLEGKPLPGRYLVVSNQPHILRQGLVANSIAPDDFDFDVIGKRLSTKEPTMIILDELARAIYQLKMRK